MRHTAQVAGIVGLGTPKKAKSQQYLQSGYGCHNGALRINWANDGSQGQASQKRRFPNHNWGYTACGTPEHQQKRPGFEMQGVKNRENSHN